MEASYIYIYIYTHTHTYIYAKKQMKKKTTKEIVDSIPNISIVTLNEPIYSKLWKTVKVLQ